MSDERQKELNEKTAQLNEQAQKQGIKEGMSISYGNRQERDALDAVKRAIRNAGQRYDLTPYQLASVFGAALGQFMATAEYSLNTGDGRALFVSPGEMHKVTDTDLYDSVQENFKFHYSLVMDDLKTRRPDVDDANIDRRKKEQRAEQEIKAILGLIGLLINEPDNKKG